MELGGISPPFKVVPTLNTTIAKGQKLLVPSEMGMGDDGRVGTLISIWMFKKAKPTNDVDCDEKRGKSSIYFMK